MDAGYDEESPRGRYEPSQSPQHDLERGQPLQGGGQDNEAAASVRFADNDVEGEAGGGGDGNTDGETAKKRKKDRSYLQSSNATGRKSAPRRSLTRSMSELQRACGQLKLPKESQQFCDFVLVFDEIVQDDINEAKRKRGCCSCCKTSYKELQECLKVYCIYIIIIIIIIACL